MKKLSVAYLGILALVLVHVALVGPAISQAAEGFGDFRVNGWQKYADPVLARRPGQFDSGLTREIAPVIVDADGTLARGAGGSLTAYYYGADDHDVWRIGRATSIDNGYSWSGRTVAVNPSGIPGSWYQGDISQPSVIQLQDGILAMLATGQQNDDLLTKQIGLLLSPDAGQTWLDAGAQVNRFMFHREDGAALTEIGVPRVIKMSDGRYLMTLEGQVAYSNAWRVFAATSPTLVGGWSPLNGGAPVLRPGAADWEDVGVANPQVNEIAPGSFVMAYNGRGTGAPQCWQVGLAASTNLVDWTRGPANPVLRHGAPGAFDEHCVETSFLAKADNFGAAKLYFQGYDVTDRPQVGIATASWNEFDLIFPGTGSDANIYARRPDGSFHRASSPGGGQWSPWQRIGSGWDQFTKVFMGTDGWIYAVRSDGAFLRNLFSGGAWAGWVQIGAGWDQFTKVFIGTDGWIYAVRNDGALLKNLYSGGSWAGWVQIGSDWTQFTHVFMGTDGWIYAVRSDGAFLRNLFSGGAWAGWVQIGAGWDQFTHVFMGTDGWIYAKRSDGRLFRNLSTGPGTWHGWEEF